MSQKKRATCLRDLCLRNIAKNVISHSKKYRESRIYKTKLRFLYQTFQGLFSDSFLKELCRIHQPCKGTGGSEGKLFADFIFGGKMWDGGNFRNCLEFVFNKYSKQIFLTCTNCTHRRTSDIVTSHILSKCKDPVDLELSKCNLKEEHFLKAMTHWQSLTSLDLSGSSCSNAMVTKIWETLPDLRTLFLANCKISDECLLHLCKKPSDNRNSSFCEENGLCCNLGKKLITLSVAGTRVTQCGFTCALLHLNSLEMFDYDTRNAASAHLSLSVLAIAQYSISRNQSPVRLKITHLYFHEGLTPSQLRKILSLCPRLKSVCLCASANILDALSKTSPGSMSAMFLKFPNSSTLNSLAMQNFLTRYGSVIEILAIDVGRGAMKVRHIFQILNRCRSLTKFKITGIIGGQYDDIVEDQPVPIKLLSFDLAQVIAIEEWQMNSFIQMMKNMVNLEILSLSPCFFRSSMFVSFLEMSNFSSLKQIVINETDVSKISLESFINPDSNLKTIALSSCKNSTTFIEKHKEIARRSNCFVNLECSRFLGFKKRILEICKMDNEGIILKHTVCNGRFC